MKSKSPLGKSVIDLEEDQSLIGSGNLMVGHDYIKKGIRPTIGVTLATKSKEANNSLTLKNERLFSERFSFGANTVVLQQINAFQNRYDFTDSQIQWLNCKGFLRVQQNDLRVEDGKAMQVFSDTQTMQLSFFYYSACLPSLYLRTCQPVLV